MLVLSAINGWFSTISANMISPARANMEYMGYICACDADTPGTLHIECYKNV